MNLWKVGDFSSNSIKRKKVLKNCTNSSTIFMDDDSLTIL